MAWILYIGDDRSAVIYILLVVKISIGNAYFVFLFDSCKGCFYLLPVASTNWVFSEVDYQGTI